MMSEIADYQTPVVTTMHADDEALERRISRAMCAAVLLAVAVSPFVWPWRVTAGLLLGGALSLVNHRWLRGSIAAAFGGAAAAGGRPRLSASRYVLRYFVVALAVWAAATLDVISVPAAIAGLCSFVAALFVEAARQFYLSIVGREDS